MVISQSFILNNVFLFLTGGALSLPVVLPHISSLNSFVKVIVFVFIVLLFILFHPKILRFAVSIVPYLNRFVKDTAYFSLFSNNFYIKINIYFIILWILTGIKLFFCILSTTAIQYQDFFIVLAAGSSSLLTGLVAIFAPGGIGVQEGVGTYVLSIIIPVQVAFFVMIISRIIQVVTELALGLAVFYNMNAKRNLATEN